MKPVPRPLETGPSNLFRLTSNLNRAMELLINQYNAVKNSSTTARTMPSSGKSR